MKFEVNSPASHHWRTARKNATTQQLLDAIAVNEAIIRGIRPHMAVGVDVRDAAEAGHQFATACHRITWLKNELNNRELRRETNIRKDLEAHQKRLREELKRKAARQERLREELKREAKHKVQAKRDILYVKMRNALVDSIGLKYPPTGVPSLLEEAARLAFPDPK